MKTKTPSPYLTCEHTFIYAMLMTCSGMMGAYTFNLRGGVFCNAQTANFVMMSIAFGKGHFAEAFYFFIPITAYFLGAVISEAFPSPVNRVGVLRWDTCLIAFEILVLFLIGFIPLHWPDHLVQVIVNFIASMQYNTFRQAEGIPMATTFCTNHVRQVGVAFAKVVRKRDFSVVKRGLVHLIMLLSFLLGGIVLTFFCPSLQEKAIWLALIPLTISLFQLLYADLTIEHALLDSTKPHGH